jgi:hypothetical protein
VSRRATLAGEGPFGAQKTKGWRSQTA